MKKHIILITFVLISVYAFPQINPHNETFSSAGSNIFFKEIKPEMIDIPSAVYLNDKWTSTTLYYNSEYTINNVKCKYDINSEIIEIDADSMIRIVHTSVIDSFSFVDENKHLHMYVNCMQFELSEYMHGFFRTLSSGKITLLEKPAVKIIESDYNVALDVGHKERRYVKTIKLFVIIDGKVDELPRKKKTINSLVQDKPLEVETYRKENKLKFRKPEDIAKMISYYNGLN